MVEATDPVARAQIQGLNDRLETVEDEREALAKLPAVAADTAATVKGLQDNQSEIRKDIRELRAALDVRFDRVDRDHVRARHMTELALQRPTFAEKFKDTMAVMIPIIVALIAAWATISAASGATP